MKKNILKSIAVVMLLSMMALAFTGCGKETKKEEKSLIGSWEYEQGGYTYVFETETSGYYDLEVSKMNFTYKVEGDNLEIQFEGNTQATKYPFSIDGNKLILKDVLGRDVVYVKK